MKEQRSESISFLQNPDRDYSGSAGVRRTVRNDGCERPKDMESIHSPRPANENSGTAGMRDASFDSVRSA